MIRAYSWMASLFFIGICAVIIHAVSTGEFRVNNIDVKIDGDIGAAEYQERVERRMAAFLGAQLWEVDVHSIKTEVIKERWIQSVQITRTLPSHLVVEVKLKPIVALYFNRRGSFFPISSDGTVFPQLRELKKIQVPLVQEDYILNNQKVREDMALMLSSLPQNSRLRLSEIAEVSYDSKEGFRLSLIGSDLVIGLGAEDTSARAARVSQVLDYLDAHNLAGQKINADFSKKVLVKLRNGR